MALLRRNRKHTGLPGVLVTARVGALSPASAHDATIATRELARRLGPGDIAIIDHLDLDQRTAQVLVASGVSAIVNAAPSTSGRFPNLGPAVVVQAGVPLLDQVGSDVLHVDDGETLRLDGDTLYRGEQVVAHGSLLTADGVDAAMERARRGLGTQLEVFTGNAAEHLRRERDLLLDSAGIPELRTPLQGRDVLVVVAGAGVREDLAALRHWIKQTRPVLVGVDEGADFLLERELTPHLVVGDLDAVSENALAAAGEVVLHVARDGRAEAVRRLEELGREYGTFVATAAGEDLALLLADTHEARTIVLAGSHHSLPEFIDGARAEMPGTFLTRLRVGSRLVDAKAVAALHHRRPSYWPLLLIVLLALAGLAAAVAATGLDTLHGTVLGDWWDSAGTWLKGLR